MPGLKDKREERQSAEKRAAQGLGNILSEIDERSENDASTAGAGKPDEAAIQTEKSEDGMPSRSHIYAKRFESVGSTTKRKYEAGKVPLLHKSLFMAIKAALDQSGEKRGRVVLTPILEEQDISRPSSSKILSCLEAYGYLRIERSPNGRGYIFEVLR